MDYRDIKEFLKDFIKYFLVALIVLLLMIYVVSLQQVIGHSMNPNYKDSDILIVNKLKYKLFQPKRFDIVDVRSKQTKFFIKRVIGLPGEHVEFKDNKLYINGKYVEENFNKDKTNDFKLEELGFDKIPEEYYFVAGDNRGDSLDSRSKSVGLISKKDFIGEILIRIWPIRK